MVAKMNRVILMGSIGFGGKYGGIYSKNASRFRNIFDLKNKSYVRT